MAILDTDVMVTKVYARLGAEDVDYAITPEEYAIVEQSANAFIARQLWDLILVVPPTLKYVDDGYRNMEFSEDAFLTTIHEMMLEEIESKLETWIKSSCWMQKESVRRTNSVIMPVTNKQKKR